MFILLTNDDGFYAPGLQTLYNVLKNDTDYDLAIVAPESQRSATGHSITLFEPLFLTKQNLRNNDQGFAVKGTPADCVKLAIQGQIIKPKPDLVISGINLGPNLGTDIFYSGTVSAAMEGVLLGVPSMAISLAGFISQDFYPAAAFIVKIIEYYKQVKEKGLINVNFPAFPSDEWRGTKVTKLGRAVYEDVFEHRLDPHGRSYYWQAGKLGLDEEKDTDLEAIQNKFISITPIHSDLTDYNRLNKWQGIIEK